MYFGYVLLMACNARIQTNYLPDRAYKTKRQMLSESKEKKTSEDIELADANPSPEAEDKEAEFAGQHFIPGTDRVVSQLMVPGAAVGNVGWKRPSTFRAGFLKLVTSGDDMLTTAGIHVVHKIEVSVVFCRMPSTSTAHFENNAPLG
jgi:hypothetical protein